MAGSARQKELAEYLAKKWREYGLEVEIPEYKVLLSTAQPTKPNMITIENNGSVEYTIEGKMKVGCMVLLKKMLIAHAQNCLMYC